MRTKTMRVGQLLALTYVRWHGIKLMPPVFEVNKAENEVNKIEVTMALGAFSIHVNGSLITMLHKALKMRKTTDGTEEDELETGPS